MDYYKKDDIKAAKAQALIIIIVFSLFWVFSDLGQDPTLDIDGHSIEAIKGE